MELHAMQLVPSVSIALNCIGEPLVAVASASLPIVGVLSAPGALFQNVIGGAVVLVFPNVNGEGPVVTFNAPLLIVPN